MSIAQNLAAVRERIARAATRAGRSPDDVTLVAVSKTFSAAHIREAYDAGVRQFGENRVQEWEGKSSQLADLVAFWHLVGHLQSNKVRRAVSLFHAVDSVDGLSLAQKLDRAVSECSAALQGGLSQSPKSKGSSGSDGIHETRAEAVTAKDGGISHAAAMPILIEVRLAPEANKSGVHPDELPAFAESILKLPHLDLRGLMTIPPLLNNPEDIRPCFRRLRELRDSLRQSLAVRHPERSEGSLLLELSMGMSYDFEVAIEEGATQVRLGTAVFGERK